MGCGNHKVGTINLDIDPNVKPDIVGCAEYLPFKENSFDMVYASHILEHTKKHDQIIQEFLRTTRYRICIIVPNFMSRNQHNDQTHIRAFCSLDEVFLKYNSRIIGHKTWVRSKLKIVRLLFTLLGKVDPFWTDELIIEVKKA
ncbi:MAG: methyltransferase domain-containing protein [Candidatus Bathyarchaeota archaeon]